jgi:hypothetical protein
MRRTLAAALLAGGVVLAAATPAAGTVIRVPDNGAQQLCGPAQLHHRAILAVVQDSQITGEFTATCDPDGPVDVWDATS